MTDSRWTRIARRFGAVFGARQEASTTFAVGFAVLLLVQIPAMDHSLLGQPDRQMMDSAFKLRADTLHDRATPALLLDIDDQTLSAVTGSAGQPFKAPAATVPRASVAQLLDFIRTAPPNQAARAVVVDVDLAAPASDGDAGVQKMSQALAAWAASATAPPLILVREAYPAQALGMDSPARVLPDSPYEAIVQKAPNIFWAGGKVLSDQNGVARELLPYECVLTRSGMKPLYSAALIAYGFMERDPSVREHSSALGWIDKAAAACTSPSAPSQPAFGERIDYHLSLELSFQNRVWPTLSKDWPGYKVCGGEQDPVFRRQSAGDVLAALSAGADISHDLICQRLVVIGGTNGVQGDFIQTPINEMSGSMVLINSARGMEMTRGGLKPIALLVQVGILFVVCMAISAAAAASDKAREHYLKHTQREDRGFAWRVMLLPLNPLVLNGTIAFAAHWLGVLMLLVSLNYGVWGFLSAPVLAAALTKSIQEFANAVQD